MVGYALGGRIDRIQLGEEMDDNLPQAFGACLINWGPVNGNYDWQMQRELMTILAGPVAEMIYIGEKLHPAFHGPWQMDWQQAWQCCQNEIADEAMRTAFLELLIQHLHQRMSDNSCWAAIAAVSDELLAHEYLEQEQLQETLDFWIG